MGRYLRFHAIVYRLAGLLFLSARLFCQTLPSGPSVTTPVGRWVAEHPSTGGIGSWWDFRPDGTVSQTLGAMVTIPFTRSGNTLTMPPEAVGAPPSHVKFTVKGDTLSLVSGGKESTYKRVGSAPSASDLLLGKWKQDPPRVPNADARLAALEQAQSKGLYSFNPDGTESVRIPMKSFEGTWNAPARTLRLQGQTVEYTFLLQGSKLFIGQLPGGRIIDSFLPDSLFE